MAGAVSRARCVLAIVLVASIGPLVASARPAHAGPVPGYNGRIAFTRVAGPYGTEGNGTYTVNSDGSDQVQLTSKTGVFGAYSADGSQLAYLNDDGIDVMNADGTNKHVLVAGASTALRMAWSPDGTRFATMVSGPNGIDIVHTDRTATDHILVGQQGDTWYPSWSPDSNQLVYWNNNQHALMVANADGTDAHAVVDTGSQTVTWPSFTPDGTKFVWSAYVCCDHTTSHVYVANLDGSNMQTIGDALNDQPAVSPDGEWVAYEHGAADSTQGVWEMRIDGTDARQVTHGPDAFPDWQPLPTPQPRFNGKIAFTPHMETTGAIYTVNPDGTALSQITTGGGIYPAYSGDGTQIACVCEFPFTIMNADGTNARQPFVGDFHGFRLSWSRDGSAFLTISSVNGLATITITSLDGQARTLFADDATNEFNPAWSADGQQIVFDRNQALWIADADGANARMVAAHGQWGAFAPDGARVAYLASDGIHVVGVDGNDDHLVSGVSGPAAFSPDGHWLAVADENQAHPGIWVMKADGSNPHQITHGLDDFPDWQPRLSAPPNLPPRAIGTAQNKKPLALFANGDASWDFDGTITSYEGRWGDNTAMTPQKYAWHKYAKPGTYLVPLTVTDDDGAKTTKKAWVNVS
jgi:Tol biopolymer transport system component